jgi:hypothetical protein
MAKVESSISAFIDPTLTLEPGSVVELSAETAHLIRELLPVAVAADLIKITDTPSFEEKKAKK